MPCRVGVSEGLSHFECVAVEAQRASHPCDLSSCFLQLSHLEVIMGHFNVTDYPVLLARYLCLREAFETHGMTKDALGSSENCLDGRHCTRIAQRKRADSARRHLPNRT